MKRTTLMVMIVTVVAKIFGFLRDRVIYYFFGYGVISDAFSLAFGIPSLLLSVVVAALVTGFIPMYTRIDHDDPDSSNTFVNNVFNILVLFSFVMGLMMFLFPGLIVKLTASGFSAEANALATQFVRIFSVSVISVAVIQLGTGFLNINDSFLLPNLISIPSNIIIIGSVVVSHSTGNTNMMGYGGAIGFTLQGVMMLIYMYRYGFRYNFILDFKDKYLNEMIIISLPVLLSSVVVALDDLLMRSYATIIHADGGYSFINSSYRLNGFATSLFVAGVLSVAYPTIAKAAAKNDRVKVVHSMHDAILLIALFIIPATIGFITLSYEVVAFVYGGGKVGPDELVVLSNIFKMSAAGLFFIGLRDLFIRIHYAYQDMKTPLKAYIIYGCVDLVLFIILGHFLGLKGLTLASSLSTTIVVFYLFDTLLKRFKRLGMSAILKDLVKIIVSSALMGIAIMILKSLLANVLSDFRMLVLSVIVGVAVYFASVMFLKVELVLSILKRKS